MNEIAILERPVLIGRPRVPEEHPDMFLFHQDRIKNGFMALMFPVACYETVDFFLGLKESPRWLSPQEIEEIDGLDRKKELYEASKQRTRFTQRMFKTAYLPEVLAHCRGRADHYFSQSKFSIPKRASERASQLTSCWIDLDFYKPSAHVDVDIRMALSNDQTTLELIVDRCTTGGKGGRWLMPTQIIRSGRGVYVKWIFNHFLPGEAAPRWRHCQAKLVEMFGDMGADVQVTDAARVLRVVGSVNGNNGDLVRVIHIGESINFDALASAVLTQERMSESDRWAVKSLKKKYDKDEAERVASGLQPCQPKRKKEWSGNSETWSTIVGRELTTLARHRGQKKVRGKIELITFIIMNYQLIAGQIKNEADFEEQVAAIATMTGANLSQLQSEVKNLYARFTGGRSMYRYKKSSILKILDITDDELVLVPVLARPPGKGHPIAKVPRASRVALHQRARILERSGLTLRNISDVLGVSTKTAKSYLKMSLD